MTWEGHRSLQFRGIFSGPVIAFKLLGATLWVLPSETQEENVQ